MKPLLLTAIVPLLAGCAQTRPVEGPVRLGQVAYVDGPKVRADRVLEDSRCPVDADCVWAGRLVVRVTVIGGAWSRQLDLTAGTPVPVADGSLTLVSATPQRHAADSPDTPLPYRFIFRFDGGL